MTNPTCPTCGVGITEHEASRCLDAWVAQKVMGWYQRYIEDIEGNWDPMANEPEFLYKPGDAYDPRRVHCYSTHIAAAWQVGERMLGQGFEVSLGSWNQRDGRVWKFDFFTEHESGRMGTIACSDAPIDQFPLAICRAAIMAMEATDATT